MLRVALILCCVFCFYLLFLLKICFGKVLENKNKRKEKGETPLETSQPGAAQFSPAHSFSPGLPFFPPPPPAPPSPSRRQLGPTRQPPLSPSLLPPTVTDLESPCAMEIDAEISASVSFG